MDNVHRADEGDFAFGRLACRAPAPSRERRGWKESDLAAAERPWWVPERYMGRIADASAT